MNTNLIILQLDGDIRIGPDETIAMVTEALEMWDSEDVY